TRVARFGRLPGVRHAASLGAPDGALSRRRPLPAAVARSPRDDVVPVSRRRADGPPPHPRARGGWATRGLQPPRPPRRRRAGADARCHHRRRCPRPQPASRLAATAATDEPDVVRRREDLTAPRGARRLSFGIHYDPEAFGDFSEGIARYF